MKVRRLRGFSMLAVCSALGLAVLGVGTSAAAAAPVSRAESVSHLAGTIWTMAPSGDGTTLAPRARPVKQDIRLTPYGTIWT